MTYKDHGEIALIFHKHLDDAKDHEPTYIALTDLMEDVMNYCQRDNTRFDRDKFMIGAGIGIV